jgi:chemotaxis methyl-accepting protein methylase
MHFDEFVKAACMSRELDGQKYRRASRKRVLERIGSLGLKGFGEYLRYLDAHAEEAQWLPNLLRVTVSRFFREHACWRNLAEEALPRLLALKTDKTLRALSLGCCNGEEPYSLALLWRESLQPKFPKHRLHLKAVDLDPTCLARAKRAVYPPKTLREVPAQIRSKWFWKENGTYRLDPRIRSQVEFRQLDLLQEPWPSGQDLIFCRYLFFTYFKGKRLNDMLQKIWQALNAFGLLMIGKKEGVGGQENPFFESVSKNGCLYRKKNTPDSGKAVRISGLDGFDKAPFLAEGRGAPGRSGTQNTGEKGSPVYRKDKL